MMTPLEYEWNALLILTAKIYTATMILPIIVALFWKKHWNLPLRIVFWFCIASFISNLLEQAFIWATMIENYYHVFAPYLAKWNIYNTFFLTILFYLRDFLLLGWLYSLIFPIKPLDKFIFQAGVVLAGAALINHLFIEGFRVFGVFNPGADALFTVILPLLYLWFSQRQSLRISLKKSPYLWISLGVLLPNLLALFLYFTGDYIHKTDFILFAKLAIAKNIFEMVAQLLISVGFMHARYARFILTSDHQPTKIGS